MSSENISQKVVCKYENFGFCMKREECENFHPTENCNDDNCSIVNCTKRHPQPCRFFGTQVGCRFGSSCKFDHKRQMCLQSELKEMRSKLAIQDEKIASLEKKLSSFMKDTIVCDDRIDNLSNLNKKRRISISHQNGDDQTNTIMDVNYKINCDDTNVRTDVEMTETTKTDDIVKQFFKHTLGILVEIKSKIQNSKIEESRKNIRFMKDKFKNFAVHNSEDIKAFVEKLEGIEKKWNTYNRNNFKTNSDNDIQKLITQIMRIQSKIYE